MAGYTQKQLETLENQKKDWMAKTAAIRDMLNSPPGKLLMEHLRMEAHNPIEGIYVPGSFDRTAFNLGVLATYNKLVAIQEGIQ